MSTLRSFSYGSYNGVDDIPEQVYMLFAGKENMKVNGEPILNYALEIIDAALEGRIKLNESFNMMGFVKAIQKNCKLVDNVRRQNVGGTNRTLF